MVWHMARHEADLARPTDPSISIRSTVVADGAAMWCLARECGLDLNSSYAYLILADDFGATCRVAHLDDEPVGYVLGYRPPGRPTHLFVWQIAVSERARGRGIARLMLNDLIDALGDVEAVEATVEASNAASRALFDAVARTRGADLVWTEGVRSEDFPDDHPGEPRLEITGL